MVGSTTAGIAFAFVRSYRFEHHNSFVSPKALAGIGFAAVPWVVSTTLQFLLYLPLFPFPPDGHSLTERSPG